jgi:hypothetical protein
LRDEYLKDEHIRDNVHIREIIYTSEMKNKKMDRKTNKATDTYLLFQKGGDEKEQKQV